MKIDLTPKNIFRWFFIAAIMLIYLVFITGQSIVVGSIASHVLAWQIVAGIGFFIGFNVFMIGLFGFFLPWLFKDWS